VFTASRIGASPVASASASRKSRVRRAVAQVSMTTTSPSACTAPALLIHQVPSGWIQAWTPGATSRSSG
jgi:hypothetical protein